MARTRYAPDRGLTVRMTLTMFLLGLVFVIFVAALIGVLSALRVSGAAIIFIAVIFGIGSAWTSLFYSDKIALRTAGAREVSPQEAPQLHGIVDRLCAMADMEKPRVAIAPTDMPNAFATGRNSKNSVLCVTDGLLRRLDDNELEGVLAHELSHVAHRDVQVMTYASVLAIIAGLLMRFAFYSELFGGGGRGRRGNQNFFLILVAIMVVSAVIYAISFLLMRLLSRYREARGRPQRRPAHRPAQRPEERAGQGQRDDVADTDAGPARGPAAQRVLLRPRAQHPRPPGQPGEALLDPPVARAADRGAGQDPAPARPDRAEELAATF